jgi:aspartyl-tRNA synthetase
VSESELEYFNERWKRTHRCGEITGSNEGEEVVLDGWVKKVRELGNLTFVDLWDRTGLVQLVVESSDSGLHGLFQTLRAEDVIACEGSVRRRPDEMINRSMTTGEIEVVVREAAVFNRSEVPPFAVTADVKANDDLRLKYRYLDLRRDPMQRNMELRHELALHVRNFLSAEGFLEIETPMLVRRTPEGARDYLVPSRLQPGKFYALPQSPQLYKQILMVAGFDRYFQLPRCLRDEDLRADRQPEHTQVDIEMSFVTEEDVFGITERLMAGLFAEAAGRKPDIPFPRMTYDEAMRKYGTDKPDLRFALEITDCSDIFRSSGFGVFRKAVEEGGVVRGIFFGGSASYSRSQIKKLEKFAKAGGAGGLVTITISNKGASTAIEKYLDKGEIDALLELFRAGPGCPGMILLVGGPEKIVSASLGLLRTHIGETHFPSSKQAFNFLWVNRFPLFEPSEGGGWQPAHHIFSMPLEEDIDRLDSDPGAVRGYLYDLVCNGTELGSGSIRIHRRQLQEKLFRIIGMSEAESRHRFGFLLDAFEYGAPPHGGIALGLDRIAMVLGGGTSIRDYIAFPKTQSATSLMEGAPSEVEQELLRELHIEVVKGNNTKS